MKSDVICVYQGQPMEAEMIKEMLSDIGIVAFVKNQIMSRLAPFQVSGGGASPAEVDVLLSDEEKARDFVEEYFGTNALKFKS